MVNVEKKEDLNIFLAAANRVDLVISVQDSIEVYAVRVHQKGF